MTDIEQLKKAVLELAKYVDAVTWRVATKQEKQMNVSIVKEVRAILEA